MISRIAALCFIVAIALLSQTPPRTGAFYSYTLAGSGNYILTFQQPASGARTVQFQAAYVYMAAAGQVEQFRNGTGATTTDASADIARINPDTTVAAALTVFTASNANNAGADVLPVVEIFGGPPGVTISIANIQMSGSGITKNYTLDMTTGGAWRVSVTWQEYE